MNYTQASPPSRLANTVTSLEDWLSSAPIFRPEHQFPEAPREDRVLRSLQIDIPRAGIGCRLNPAFGFRHGALVKGSFRRQRAFASTA